MWRPGAGAARAIRIMFERGNKKHPFSSDPESDCRGIPSKILSNPKVGKSVAEAFLKFFPDLLKELPKRFTEFEHFSPETMLCNDNGAYSLLTTSETLRRTDKAFLETLGFCAMFGISIMGLPLFAAS